MRQPSFDPELIPALLDWFSKNARDLPWRRTLDPYAIWVSEMMLQQTQVQTVLPYFENWMHQFPDVQTLASAPLENVLKVWAGLGYYRRARFIHQAAAVIAREHHGQFPTDYEAIRALPGVGRYTAGAVASIAFNQAAPILDGNVKRVLARVQGITRSLDDTLVEKELWRTSERLVEAAREFGGVSKKSRSCSAFNQAMMELGALICKPREPLCQRCPIQEYCVAFAKKLTGKIPRLRERPETLNRYWTALVVQQEDRVLVRQRDSQVVNGGLWEFPNREIAKDREAELDARAWLGLSSGVVRKLGRIQHTITRYRNHVEVFHCEAFPVNSFADCTWVAIPKLTDLAFPSAHRRIVTWIMDVPFASSPTPAPPEWKDPQSTWTTR